MTRLARSPKGLWGEILRENRAEVARALVAVGRRLTARGSGAARSRPHTRSKAASRGAKRR